MHGAVFQDSAYYQRRKTKEVRVGNLGIGGSNPIRIQSMINTELSDTKSSINQIVQLYDSGCDLIRAAIPNLNTVEHFRVIVETLRDKGIMVPLCADVHFSANIAYKVAEFVEKIRINPGNFAEEQEDLTDEGARSIIKEKLQPLIEIAKERKRVIRIGVNHGSLSPRIIKKYGRSTKAMVESALEYIELCEEMEFYEIVVSLKSSDVRSMVQANHLLVQHLDTSDKPYPIHVGVTEAGFGTNAIIKSYLGIGRLLEDGIGDTFRVSLTGDPVNEIPIAKHLSNRYSKRGFTSSRHIINRALKLANEPIQDFQIPMDEEIIRYTRGFSIGPVAIGANDPIQVEVHLGDGRYPVSNFKKWKEEFIKIIEFVRPYEHIVCLTLKKLEELDYIPSILSTLEKTKIKVPIAAYIEHNAILASRSFELFDKVTFIPTAVGTRLQWTDEIGSLMDIAGSYNKTLQITLSPKIIPPHIQKNFGHTAMGVIETAKQLIPVLTSHHFRNFIFGLEGDQILPTARHIFTLLRHQSLFYPIFLKSPLPEEGEYNLDAIISLGALLTDGIGDIIQISGLGNPYKQVEQAHQILQGGNLQRFSANIIACPTCGRATFNVDKEARKIFERFGHLKHLTIAVMGCMVNGPGEMQDADYGYVGSKMGLINIYKADQLVEKAVVEEKALSVLEKIIKENGDWREPSAD